MKIAYINPKYIEWISPEQMHQSSNDWLSELLFIKDEHQFFEDLITSFTSKLIAPETFSNNKEIIDALNKSQKHNNLLIEAIKVHKNELQIMMDGIDEPKKEKAYKDSHRGLIIKLEEFYDEYKELKTQLFDIIKTIRKEEKQKHLLDKH